MQNFNWLNYLQTHAQALYPSAEVWLECRATQYPTYYIDAPKKILDKIANQINKDWDTGLLPNNVITDIKVHDNIYNLKIEDVT